MKKIILSSLALISCFSLMACQGKPSSSASAATYSISYDANAAYTVTGLESSYSAGDTVTFNVESNSVFYTIGDVYAGQTKLDEGTTGYTFTMPSNDVNLSIELVEVGEYDDLSDHLSWAKSIPSTISTASETDKDSSFPVTQDLGFIFDGISSANYITSIKSTIEVSNESVIPSDAISFKTITASSSNVIVGGKLVVDLRKVSPGETYIYVNLDPNNSSLGTLIKKFTVVEYGTIPVETMNVTFHFENNSKFSNNVFLNLTDMQYIYGNEVTLTPTATIYLDDIKENTYTFKYIVGHTYRVSCAYAVYNEETGYYEDMTDLSLDEWVGSGSTSTGLNQFTDGILSLITPNIEVTFTINN